MITIYENNNYKPVKYKGYTIKYIPRSNYFNIYDNENEMYDYGFATEKAAKEYIDYITAAYTDDVETYEENVVNEKTEYDYDTDSYYDVPDTRETDIDFKITIYMPDFIQGLDNDVDDGYVDEDEADNEINYVIDSIQEAFNNCSDLDDFHFGFYDINNERTGIVVGGDVKGSYTTFDVDSDDIESEENPADSIDFMAILKNSLPEDIFNFIDSVDFDAIDINYN